MIRRAILLFAVTVAAAQSLPAAVQYQFHQTRHSEVRGVPSMDITGTAIIDGDRSRIDYTGGIGGYPKGTYFIATDGARTVVFIDPASKVYSEVDTANVSAAVGSARIAVANVKTNVERLEDHPTVAGFTTEHNRVTLTYEMSMMFGTLVLKQDVKTVIDRWTTDAFGDITASFISSGAFRTGNIQLDSVLEAETMRFKGLPLRQMVRVTTTSQNARVPDSKLAFEPSRNQVTEYNVTEIHTTAAAPAMFRIPAGFHKTDAPADESPITNVTLQPTGK